MNALWDCRALRDGDHNALGQGLRFIETGQSKRALETIAHCADSDAKALVQASAYDRLGNSQIVLAIGARSFLKDSSILTQQGRGLLLALFKRAAQAVDVELYDVLKTPTAARNKSYAGIVKAFYFGGLAHGECTLYQRALDGERQLRKRRETLRTNRSLVYRLEFLKHYSSYTPLTELSDASLGGGYFLVADGFGCVIDPGYDFLPNFTRRHSIADVDAVIVTHCHDDHNADLPALLSLLYRQIPPREIQLYLDRHTFNAHRHLILSSGYVRKPCMPISASFCGWPDNSPWITMSNTISMRPVPAYHKLTRDDNGESAVGLHFMVQGPHHACHLVISGDTAWIPETMYKVYQGFAQYRPILVAHVSTACGHEAKGALGIDGGGYHANHLGVRGTTEMIKACCPSRIVLSEIGEELRDCIRDLAQLIETSTGVRCSVGMMDDWAGEVVSLVSPGNDGDPGSSSP
jgi:hypothetical protein